MNKHVYDAFTYEASSINLSIRTQLGYKSVTISFIPSFKRALNNRLLSIFEVFVVLLLAFVGSKVT